MDSTSSDLRRQGLTLRFVQVHFRRRWVTSRAGQFICHTTSSQEEFRPHTPTFSHSQWTTISCLTCTKLGLLCPTILLRYGRSVGVVIALQGPSQRGSLPLRLSSRSICRIINLQVKVVVAFIFLLDELLVLFGSDDLRK
jgi:hypothetical protein